ncbi:hypothetical protein V6N13_142858 [Hibiscus sabdariffa]|uniref:Uncharacterized protein n=1 Tax=Hibiscus sabdariffa TaxID=183260 RepID=A0ABR2FFG8_9ROSI
MAKSMRSKREKRLRAIRREIVEPFYQKKDDAKMAAIEAALAAPKLPAPASMQLEEQVAAPDSTTTNLTSMEVEMDDSDEGKTKASLRAAGGIGKKSKRKFKMGKKNRRTRGKGKLRGKRNL